MKLRGASRVRRLLEEKKGDAFLSRDLATVKRDVPIKMGLESLRARSPEIDKARMLFTELGFTNLLKLLENEHPSQA
jgi:DNA polymerase I